MKIRTLLLIVLVINFFQLLDSNFFDEITLNGISDNSRRSKISSPLSVQYTTRGPIIINGNGGFSGFTGEGTQENPYLIQNYYITSTTTILIGIFNTDKWVKIANNKLDNVNYAVEGIYFLNVKNAIVENNIITNSRHGIYLDNSDNNIIRNNGISNVAESAIRLNNSLSNVIQSNTISNSVHHGIWLNQSTNNILQNNTISESYNGLWLKSSSNMNNITNNSINSSYHAIWISSSNSNNITYNTLKNNIYGFYATSTGYPEDPLVIADSNRISNNTIFNSTLYGILLEDGVSNTVITYNMFLANYLNSSSQAFDNGSFNLFTNNFWDDWTGPDIFQADNFVPKSDGFVDDSYEIKGSASNFDNRSLVSYITQLNFEFLSRPMIYYPKNGTSLNGVVTVKWTKSLDAFDNSVSYALYYSNNSGIDWYLIQSNIAFTEYQWNTYYLANGTYYKLKAVASNSLGLISSYTSYNLFTIQNYGHSLTNPKITAPAVNSILSGNISVQWISAVDSWSGLLKYSIFYSNNTGITWIMAVENVTGNSFQWNTTTIPDGSSYLLKVVAIASDGINSSDITDGYFSIRNVPRTLSQITLYSPNGGETVNGSVTIRWSIVYDSWEQGITYSLFYSNNSGLEWVLIISDVDGYQFVWSTLTLSGGSNYLIKVQAKTTGVLTNSDTSDNTFTILKINHLLSSFSIIAPNGGESLSGLVLIQWSKSIDLWNHPVQYSLYYSIDGGSQWNLIFANISETNFSWDTKPIPDGSNNLIKVVASCSEGVTTQDVSDSTFIINNVNNTNTVTSNTETTTPISNSTKPGSSGNPLINIIAIGGAVIGLGLVGTVSTLFILRKRSKK